MQLDQVVSPDQQDAPGACCFDDQFVAWLQPCLAKRLDGQRGLMLAADPSAPASALFLYSLHDE
jgi:hypothetical protein